MGPELSELDRRVVQGLDQAQAILDAGCGEGRLTWYLAQETHQQVIGLDLSDSGFSKARDLADKAGVRELVQCLKGDVRDLAFPAGRFDVAILVHTLHHIEDLSMALREIHRVLRSDGTIMVGEFEVKEGGEKAGCRQFSLSELVEALSEVGFQDTRWERLEDDDLLVVAGKGCEDPPLG